MINHKHTLILIVPSQTYFFSFPFHARKTHLKQKENEKKKKQHLDHHREYHRNITTHLLATHGNRIVGRRKCNPRTGRSNRTGDPIGSPAYILRFRNIRIYFLQNNRIKRNLSGTGKEQEYIYNQVQQRQLLHLKRITPVHDKYHDQHGKDQRNCRQAGKRPDNKKYRAPDLGADNHDQGSVLPNPIGSGNSADNAENEVNLASP